MGSAGMIAAINRRHGVVWGLGGTPAAALDDARSELATKSDRVRLVGLGRIEYATLAPDADPVTMDGAVLFGHIRQVSGGLQLEIPL
jgi:hypothetical protein